MKRLKENKGITLVALIITIIVLLIIAAVTIMALDGEDGIISKSRQAKADYEKGQEEERGIFSEFESMLAREETDIKYTEISIEEAQQDAMLSRIDNTTTYDINNKPINIPAGFKILVNETTGYTSENISVDQGIVITDGTNEFVWVPVETKIEAYGLGTQENREPDVVTKVWYRADSDNKWWKEGGADANIDYLNIINYILGTKYQNSNDFLTDLKADFEEMSNSISKNHGFYVGRYESSLNAGSVQSVKGVQSATAEESSANTWYGLYAYQKKYSTSSVQGSMIWGSQYNAMITWMQSKGIDINSNIGENRNLARITGIKETDKINNIYDLYGNNCEWTLEATSIAYRVMRGGSIRDDCGPGQWSATSPINDMYDNGSRLTLYIK